MYAFQKSIKKKILDNDDPNITNILPLLLVLLITMIDNLPTYILMLLIMNSRYICLFVSCVSCGFARLFVVLQLIFENNYEQTFDIGQKIAPISSDY